MLAYTKPSASKYEQGRAWINCTVLMTGMECAFCVAVLRRP